MVLDDAAMLPTHARTNTLTATGGRTKRVVVWVDRSYDQCPRCCQPIPVVVDNCPVFLNAGKIEEWSQQHSCGYRLSVRWMEVTERSGEDPTDDDVLRVAAALTAERQEDISDACEAIRAGLRRELRAALVRRDEPLADGETPEDRAYKITTGSEVEPGVYRIGDDWVAWAWPPVPDADPETIVVCVSDLGGWPRARSASGTRSTSA